MDWLIDNFNCKKNKCSFSEALPNKIYYWKCLKNKRHHYKCSISERIRRRNFTDHEGCPRCIFYGEEVVKEYLRSLFIDYNQEFKFVWSGSYRYDILIPHLKTIIEVDGKQHFTTKRKWGSLKDRQATDVLKMKLAFKNDHHMIRINQMDVIDKSKFDWKTVLSDTIKMCQDPSIKPSLFLITSNEMLYNKHLELLKNN